MEKTHIFEKIMKRGIYEFAYLDGNCWLKIFHQKFNKDNLFKNETEAEYIISEEKYSILRDITENYKIDNQYHFIIYYPEFSNYFRWKQSIFPLDEIEGNETEAEGFELVKNTTEGYKFGGLVKTNATDSKGNVNSLLDGNPGFGTWYFAIGMYQNADSHWKSSGIPSYLSNATNAAQYVSLWLRLAYPIRLLYLSCHNNIFSLSVRHLLYVIYLS